MIEILTHKSAKQLGVERGLLFSDSANSIFSDVYSDSSFLTSFIFLCHLARYIWILPILVVRAPAVLVRNVKLIMQWILWIIVHIVERMDIGGLAFTV